MEGTISIFTTEVKGGSSSYPGKSPLQVEGLRREEQEGNSDKSKAAGLIKLSISLKGKRN